MEKNKNGKYDVLHQSKQEWIEVNEDWLNNVQLKGVHELRFTTGHGSNHETLETVMWNGSSVYYQNVHGSWSRR